MVRYALKSCSIAVKCVSEYFCSIMNCILNFKKFFSNDFYLFKLVWIFLTDLVNMFVIVFYKALCYKWLHQFRVLFNHFKDILNIIVLLFTLNLLTSLISFSLSLNILKTFPWWYAMDVVFFFFVQIISSYCFIMAAGSSGLPALSARSFNFSVSIVSLFTMESINCSFISSLLNLLVFLVFLEPFCSCKQKVTFMPQI